MNAAGGEAAHSERKLRRRDKLFLVAALLLGAASLAVGFALYPRVNPEASIRFTADRGESEQIARRFLAARDLDVAGRRHASRFLYDDEAKVFLERSLGAARANELMADSVRMWRWGHRWFRPLQKEEMSVSVATTGQVAAFNHLLPEDAPGADLDPEAARALAEEFLRSSMGRDPRGLEFLEGTREKKPARTDYLFTWRSRAPNLGTGEYRVQVRIQGDRPGAYREFVHIPESWARDYAQLRSRNMAAGVAASVLLLLTFLAVVVVVIARMRTREIRWRTALIFGAVGMALQLLAGFNSLPVSLFAYDTTASFGGFLTGQIFGVFRDALLWGMAIMLLTAGGEALYRQAYPEKISLTGLFTWRGLRTRRFLLSSVLGLCATCVFFAYQEVFYATARRLGAWAPMDVPYDELLNTAFPWIFVLLIGFQPAVTEEFLSRMFSIPFLRKYTRSAFLAVVLPALIWGFAHANYPNQPFYIRGVEVGLVGIVAGLTMLRVNVLAVLVWHFTVDALLTAYLLFRSGNPYYIISAAAAGGLILLPVGYAAIAYLRRKEFAEPHPLLNGADRAPQEAERPEAVPEEPVAPVPMETGGYTRWSKRRRLGAVLAGAVSLLLLLLPEGGIRPGVRLPLRPGEVREKGAQWLRALGQEPDSFRVSQVLIEAGNDSSAEFSLKHAGLDRLRAFYGDFSPPVIWRLRYFRPLQARELRLRMDGEEGRVLAYARHLAEKDSVPTVDQDSALVLAREFLFEQGADLEGYDLQQASAARRPHRTDYTFSWETREDDPRDIGSARPRIEVVVQGSQVGEYLRSLKLPEQWMRQRNRNTLIDSLRLILSILAGGAVLGLLLWILLQAHRKGQVPWKALFRWTWPWTLIFAVGSLNNWPRLLSRYDTSVPYGGYLLIMGFGLALGLVVSYLFLVLALAMGLAAWPEARGLRFAALRREQLPDAWIGALSGLLILLALRRLGSSLILLWPGLVPLPSAPDPAHAASPSPLLGLLFDFLRFGPWVLGVAAGIAGLLRLRGRSPALAAALLVAVIVALVPLSSKTGPEFLLGLAWTVVEVAVLLFTLRLCLSGSLLALPVLVYLAVGLWAVSPFLSVGSPWLARQGVYGACLLALPLIGLVWAGVRGGRQTSSGG